MDMNLLPYCHCINLLLFFRGIIGRRSTVSLSESYEAKEKYFEETDTSESKSASPHSVENSDGSMTYLKINKRYIP